MEGVVLAILLIIAAISVALVIAVLRRITKEDERIAEEKAAATVVETNNDQAEVVNEVSEVLDECTDTDATEYVDTTDNDTDTVVEESAAATVVNNDVQIVDGDAVVFSATKETLQQKYDGLSDEMKSYYDQIVAAASVVEGNRCFKNDRYEEYKVGKNSIVRLLIKRGIIVCEFVIANSDLRNYMADNKLKVKQAPTTLKVFDDVTLAAAKETMAIAVKAIEEEKQYKKEQARAKRKAAKAAAEAETKDE